ncbi:penicillin-binding protein 2 [Erysipelothrix sp. HDW6C]|uniref:peptidoglycan D,D-transpeptidase FtsI family protein n=1 Tax=Erysipelothrix sp. HDW6C TaxID=2714930 RepID=UPI00140ACA9C|nr:penicillin-binding protein 2 [Erysipelothrix sp. HDW6C]QIK70159.1 penicillin-binding protein 2 [Erysipelothrix sp. HDW6C]
MNSSKGKDKVKDYSGSSEHLKKDMNINKTINVRLKLFIGLLLVIMAGLIYRLYDVQILQAEHFETLYDKYQTPPIYAPTMRGEFYDRNMKSLVTNKASKVIVYYRPRNISDSDEWENAGRFAKQFNVKHNLNDDDLRVLWLRLNDYGPDKVTDEEFKQLEKGEITQAAYENLKKSRITDAELATLTEESKDTFNMLIKMQNIQMGQSATVLEDATNEQIAYISEHAADYPGFSYTTTWDREYSKDIRIADLIGSVGDIPAEKLAYYTAIGYQNNDKVGTYGLESQYERLLSGVDSQYERTSGHMELSQEGRKGVDLRISIDTDLQKYVEEALQAKLEEVRRDPRRQMAEQMHMVVSDPNTGDVLAIAAIKYNKEKGTYYNDIQSPMISAFPVGSTVKPATVYAGLTEGAITKNDYFYDTPMLISGTPPRESWKEGIGNVNAVTALQQSSNIFMFHVAIRLGHTEYIQNGPLVFPDPVATYDLMRNYYSQFGLGVPTQVDYPREETGFKGNKDNPGSLLEFAIGQFDNYTTLQMSQYINTIANDGKRVAPRFVIEGLDQNTKKTVYENPVKLLNTLEDIESLRVAQEGMRLYISSDEGYATMPEKFTSAGKSGTAQDYLDGVMVRNYSYIVYAPYEKPRVTVACIAPTNVTDSHATERNSGVTNSCGEVSTQVLDYYMGR